MRDLREYHRLVEENHKLIYAFMQKYHLSEDWYGDCAIGLCKAAMTFDESKGYKFSTFAYKIMYNAMAMRYRDYENRSLPTVSLNAMISEDSDDEYNSMIPDSNDYIAVSEDINMIEWVLQASSLRDLKIIWYRMNGMTYDKIGEMVGLGQPQVTRRMKLLKKSFYDRRRFMCGRTVKKSDDHECEEYRRRILKRLKSIGLTGQ